MDMKKNKLYNLIKYYAVDSINAVIVGDDKFLPAVKSGMSTRDNLLDEELYSHISEFDLKKVAHLNPEAPTSCDLLILDFDKCQDVYTTLQQYKMFNDEDNLATDVIFVVKSDGVSELVNDEIWADWDLTEEDDCYILEYNPDHYQFQDYKKLYHVYELMSCVHDTLCDMDIPYVLSRTSCLGAFRNRNHLVHENNVYLNVDKSYVNVDLEKTFERLGFDVVECKGRQISWGGNKKFAKVLQIYITSKIYVEIEFTIDHFNKELYGEPKIYTYGPIKVFSLQKPISYLVQEFGQTVFTEMISKDGQIVKTPKRLYDCYYNSWSPYTSRFCKKKIAEHLKKTTEEFTRQGIRWWIDCGTLLGAVRNGRIPLFDDDADIGVLSPTPRIQQECIQYKTNFNAEQFYAGKLHRHVNRIEEINYMFVSGWLTGTETRGYCTHDDMYVSTKDDVVSNAHGVPGLKSKRAVEKFWFDNELEEIKLEGFTFKCPADPYGYITQPARYGEHSVDGDPIRNGKPGGDVLRDDF